MTEECLNIVHLCEINFYLIFFEELCEYEFDNPWKFIKECIKVFAFLTNYSSWKSFLKICLEIEHMFNSTIYFTRPSFFTFFPQQNIQNKFWKKNNIFYHSVLAFLFCKLLCCPLPFLKSPFLFPFKVSFFTRFLVSSWTFSLLPFSSFFCCFCLMASLFPPCFFVFVFLSALLVTSTVDSAFSALCSFPYFSTLFSDFFKFLFFFPFLSFLFLLLLGFCCVSAASSVYSLGYSTVSLTVSAITFFSAFLAAILRSFLEADLFSSSLLAEWSFFWFLASFFSLRDF